MAIDKELEKEIEKRKDGDGYVKVDAKKLNDLMNRLDRLESAASKAGLQKYDDQHKGQVGKIVRLNMIDGKVIVSWRMTKNNVEKTPAGQWKEEQEIEITYEDGKKEEMPYVYFARRAQHLRAHVKREILLQDEEEVKSMGDRIFSVMTDDDRKYEIGSNFVN